VKESPPHPQIAPTSSPVITGTHDTQQAIYDRAAVLAGVLEGLATDINDINRAFTYHQQLMSELFDRIVVLEERLARVEGRV